MRISIWLDESQECKLIVDHWCNKTSLCKSIKMSLLNRVAYVIAIVACCSGSLVAQSELQDKHDSSKWLKTIEKFEQADITNPTPQHSILFVGSSSIRGWNLKKSFPHWTTVNRGFGGSQLADSVQFIDRIVLNHKPNAIVLYAGDNDINAGKSPERVFADFTEFVAITQKELPKTSIHFIAIKPSIKRWNLREKNRRANKLIQSYCELNDKLFFVDIDTPMLQSDGTLAPDWFAKDGLHLSPKGYSLWAEKVKKSINQPGGTATRIPDHSRRRIIVLTDITNEPDDEQSMVRFLCYANEFDVEGLIATTSCWLREQVVPQKIIDRVKAYGKVLSNLELHASGWPSEEQLLSVIKSSVPRFGMAGVGQGQNSNGSQHIIEVVDRADPRPVYVSVWGGANCLAQALWQIKNTRTEEEVNRFVSKLRVYTISDQDDSGPWMRKTFPNLIYVVSPGREEEGGHGYHHATWTGISGDKVHGRFSGPDFSIVDNPWLDKNIRKDHGPLGALHPETKFLMEGDTPSFLWLVNNGLNHPEDLSFGGWGGRYELYTPPKQSWHYQQAPRPIWTDALDEVVGGDGKMRRSNQATIWRWREAYQNDFAARMDWSNSSNTTEANHAPTISVDGKGSGEVIYKNVLSTSVVELIAMAQDPDGDDVDIEWIHYKEAGTYPGELKLLNSEGKVSFNAPNVKSPKTVHLIAQAKDQGSPSLFAYQRVVLTIKPNLSDQLSDKRPRIFITTDISDTAGDPDDIQSLAHLLLYADQFDIRGIATERFDESALRACEEVIQKYEFDYNCPWTKFRQLGYPTPDRLRSLISANKNTAYLRLAKEMRSNDSRPLYILAWGDLNLAYTSLSLVNTSNKAFVNKVRLLSIATNRRANKDNGTGQLVNWNSSGRNKVFGSFPSLWWIENDWTYNGMFVGPEPGEMKKFLATNAGQLGQHIGDVVKQVEGSDYFRAADTPTVLYLLDPNHNPRKPSEQSWAGKFQKPFPRSRPRYWTGIGKDMKWNYLNPQKTWDNADKVYQARIDTFLETRDDAYENLKSKVAMLYGTNFTYDQKIELEKQQARKAKSGKVSNVDSGKPKARPGFRVGPK